MYKINKLFLLHFGIINISKLIQRLDYMSFQEIVTTWSRIIRNGNITLACEVIIRLLVKS